jgi:hypothetical protein
VYACLLQVDVAPPQSEQLAHDGQMVPVSNRLSSRGYRCLRSEAAGSARRQGNPAANPRCATKFSKQRRSALTTLNGQRAE